MKKRPFGILFLSLVFVCSSVVIPGVGQSNVDHASLFRYSGDGVLPLYNVFSKEMDEIRYRDAKGNYDDEALAEIDRLLACHSNNEGIPMSLKLIELLDHLQDHFNASRIDVISGYRSPEYNVSLRKRNRRVARQSMHLRGRAVDVKFQGVNSREIRNYAVSLQAGGVGYYGRNRFVHIDTGPVRTW